MFPCPLTIKVSRHEKELDILLKGSQHCMRDFRESDIGATKEIYETSCVHTKECVSLSSPTKKHEKPNDNRVEACVYNKKKTKNETSLHTRLYANSQHTKTDFFGSKKHCPNVKLFITCAS